MSSNVSRRSLLGGVVGAGVLPACGGVAKGAKMASAGAELRIPAAVQSGDVTRDAAVIWARSDRRAAHMVVEWATNDSFSDAHPVDGPQLTADSDFTGTVDLSGLPAGTAISYRVSLLDPQTGKPLAEPMRGRLKTAPDTRNDVLFVWSGDTCGQSWGIDPDRGGLKVYEMMRRLSPDFYINSGDMIYADEVIHPEVQMESGVWRNLVTPAKSKVAETLDDFRGNFAYNFLDENVRKFLSEVPMIAQWDDHEVYNNWWPGQPLDPKRFHQARNSNELFPHAWRAFFEYMPIRTRGTPAATIFRTVPRGPLLDVFVLDERSYRGPNSENLQTTQDRESAFVGSAQLAWLKQALASSTALWKVIASDMPLGVIEGDGKRNGRPMFDAWANGNNGPPMGRELEMLDLLQFVTQRGIKNLVMLTADVHYPAAHYFDPAKARVPGMPSFWEFIAGPIQANPFGPNQVDDTFGTQVRYRRPPIKGLLNNTHQTFGSVQINGQSGVMTVRIHGSVGEILHVEALHPA